MNIKPLGQRIVVELFKAEKKTASGIIIPDSATEKQSKAKVLAISQELKDDEKNVLKEGDSVIFNEYSGTKIKDDKNDVLILDIADVLAII